MQSIYDGGPALFRSITPSSEERSEAISIENTPGQDVQPAFFDWRSLSPSLHPDTDALFDPGRTRVAYTGDGFTEGEYGSGKQRFGDTDKQTYGLPPQMPAMEGLGQQQLRTPSEGSWDLEFLDSQFPSSLHECCTGYTPPTGVEAYMTGSPDGAQDTAAVAMPTLQQTAHVLHSGSQALPAHEPAVPAPPGKIRLDRQPSLYGALVRGPGHGPFYCQFPDCQELFKRGYDLERHEKTVHQLSGMHYHCNHLGCDRQNRRLDRLREHCRRVHKDVKGQEKIETVVDDEAKRVGCPFATCEEYGAGSEVRQSVRRRAGKRKRRDASCPTCHSKSGRSRN